MSLDRKNASATPSKKTTSTGSMLDRITDAKHVNTSSAPTPASTNTKGVATAAPAKRAVFASIKELCQLLVVNNPAVDHVEPSLYLKKPDGNAYAYLDGHDSKHNVVVKAGYAHKGFMAPQLDIACEWYEVPRSPRR